MFSYDYYHGYFLFDKFDHPIRYPFGYGLSYTKFEYIKLHLSKQEIAPTETFTISVHIQNSGDRAGVEIVQLYIGYDNPTIERHHKDLKGFSRISLEPGQIEQIDFELKMSDLSYYDPTKCEWICDPIKYKVYVGPSSVDHSCLIAHFRVIQ